MSGSMRMLCVLGALALLFVASGLTSAQEEDGDGVTRAAFTTGIEEREPVDEVDSLATTIDKVFFFTEVTGMEGDTLTHRWLHGGETLAEVKFGIGGPRWRVWSSKNLIAEWVGEWTVECVDGAGNMVHEASFVYYAME